MVYLQYVLILYLCASLLLGLVIALVCIDEDILPHKEGAFYFNDYRYTLFGRIMLFILVILLLMSYIVAYLIIGINKLSKLIKKIFTILCTKKEYR